MYRILWKIQSDSYRRSFNKRKFNIREPSFEKCNYTKFHKKMH